MSALNESGQHNLASSLSEVMEEIWQTDCCKVHQHSQSESGIYCLSTVYHSFVFSVIFKIVGNLNTLVLDQSLDYTSSSRIEPSFTSSYNY